MNISVKFPTHLGPIHFIGIGGIGMSGIAEVLIEYGYIVQGSDLQKSKITNRLKSLGVQVFYGHKAKNVANADVVVLSAAIKSDNIELQAAYRHGLPVVRRADMLAELMRLKSNVAVAGTHGKTTTTTLVAALLEAGGLDPTVINGGVIHAFDSNARFGSGDWTIVEADESDGSFTRLPVTIAVITNIDPEHMEYYITLEKLHAAFEKFASNIPFYGVAVCNTDHAVVQSLVTKITDRRVISYGFNMQADVRAKNLHYVAGNAHFDVILATEGRCVNNIILPMSGDYNVSNTLAAIAVARHLGIGVADIRGALARFSGVNRRFTRLGIVNGVLIIDDYAHHPVEIKAVIMAARHTTEGRLIVIHQPHRYSRLKNLFDEFCNCFNEADVVGITAVYAAGESPISGAEQSDLLFGLHRAGHKSVVAVNEENGLIDFFKQNCKAGDVLLCLGAGTISAWAHNLINKLSQ